MNLSRDEILVILEQGIESPFWQYLMKEWEKLRVKNMQMLLNPTYGAQREFIAGAVAALDELLNWPKDKIEQIRREQKIKAQYETPK